LFRKKTTNATTDDEPKTTPAITETALQITVKRTRATRKATQERQVKMIEYLTANPNEQNITIAKLTSVDKATVSKMRRKLEAAGQITPKIRKTPVPSADAPFQA